MNKEEIIKLFIKKVESKNYQFQSKEDEELWIKERERLSIELYCCNACGICCKWEETPYRYLYSADLALWKNKVPIVNFNTKDRECIYLGDKGCMLSRDKRPTACITFVCISCQPKHKEDLTKLIAHHSKSYMKYPNLMGGK